MQTHFTFTIVSNTHTLSTSNSPHAHTARDSRMTALATHTHVRAQLMVVSCLDKSITNGRCISCIWFTSAHILVSTPPTNGSHFAWLYYGHTCIHMSMRGRKSTISDRGITSRASSSSLARERERERCQTVSRQLHYTHLDLIFFTTLSTYLSACDTHQYHYTILTTYTEYILLRFP